MNGIVYTPNTLNQYTKVGAATYAYDLNGNLTNDGASAYTYDEDNRLATVVKGATAASYSYDALDRRVSKTVNGVAKHFVYDGDEIVEERNSTGGLLADYVYSDQLDEVITMTRGTNTYYYFQNRLGSVTEILDAAGLIKEHYTYGPFGTPSVTTSVISNPWRFAGRYYDEESGLYDYRARAYSSVIGRFLQRDPLGYVDGMNLYSYVKNSPQKYKDPYGKNLAVLIPVFGWIPVVQEVVLACGTVATVVVLTWGIVDWVLKKEDKKKRDRVTSPVKGDPNSSGAFGNDDEVTERFYDENGNADVDIDYGHPHGGLDDPHYHEWEWSNGKPKRGPGQNLP